MAWKANRRLARDFPDLLYLPKGRCEWDCTLASLAFGVRRAILVGPPDLSAWAARHGLPASARYQALGDAARVLWHGTSRERAEKIAEHGLFHKRGLWTTLNPFISHGFTRGRSERFGTEGAVVCLVLDRGAVERGADFDVEGAGDVFRFTHGLPPDVVEYVLVREEAHFLGERAAGPQPWRGARLKKREGQWVPQQQPPVRYGDGLRYASLRAFCELTLDRLLAELGPVTALEVFSTLYALVAPWDALEHDELFALLDERGQPHRRHARWRTFRARDPLADPSLAT